MEIKNLFTPEAQQFGSQLAGIAKKVTKPLEQPIQQLGEQFTAKIQPAVQGIQDTVNTSFVEPIMKPIERNNKITKVNKFLADKGITVDDIKNLAEADGSDPEEALQFFRDNGIQIEGMEQLQPQQVEQLQPQPEGLADQFKMKSSEEFGVMEGVKDIGKFFVNLPADSAEAVGGLYDAVTSPIETTKGILKVGQGLSDKAVYGLGNSILTSLGYTPVNPTVDAQMVDAIGTHIKDTYGTPGKFKKAIVENPADTLLTIMGILGPVKKLADANKLVNVSANIDKLQSVINPVNILKKEAQLVGKVTELPGKGIKKIGEALYKTAIKPNVAEAEKILQYKAGLGSKPTTVAETALKKGIAGTETRIGVQALKKADQIFKKEVNPILEKSKTEHDLGSLFNKAEKSIDSMKEGVLRKSELKEGLEALKEEYASLGSDKFTTKALQQEKSSLDKFTPDKVFRGKPIASSYNEAKNILANVFRDEVHTDLGKFGLKSQEAFRDYANLKELSKVGIKGLTDSGFKGGFGGFWTTMYEQATTPIKTIGGQVLYKVGDKLEFLGPKGINKLGDFLKDKFSIDKKGILVPKQGTNVNNPINSTSKTVPGVIKPVVKGVTPKKDSLQEKSIITPQTMEKGIIQESKQGISPNVKRPNGNINNTPNNTGNIPVGNGIKPIVTHTVPKNTVNTPIVEKTATEVIKPKNSIYTSQEKAESYVKWHEKELQNPGISKKSITYLKKGLEDAKQEVELWKSLNKSNAKQQGITPRSTTTNVFGETIDKPSNKTGGFIKIPEIGKKSEIKPEIEKYLKTQNIYDKKQGEYGTILKKLSEEYSDGKGGISDEGRLLPKYKEAKKNFDYYFKLLQDFNGLESSKKASKEFNKLGIVERQKIRRQINETKSKINVNDDSVGLGSDSNKSIPVKNPLVEEARKIGIDLNKYFENVSEKSAIKMADYASDIVGKKMVKGERPMDMSELGMLSNKINKNEAGGNITTVGNILKDSELRKLYEKSLDTPITILDERVAKKGQLGGYVPIGEGRYGGHIVLFGGNKEISNNLPKSLLHEAAHSIRDSKGRSLVEDYRISPTK